MAPKRIIVCADGTWKVPYPVAGKRRSNVAKVARAVLPRGDDGVKQAVFYEEGIGAKGKLDWLIGGYLGIGLSQKVLDAYRFLAENWTEGDEVYLFGFSRGAFTVRSLAGFLGLCGLLREKDLTELPGAWRIFESRGGAQRLEETARIRSKAQHPFAVKMIGVWDTVDSLGLPVPGLREMTRPRLRFQDAKLGGHVGNGFQALAIDEIRSAFVPTLWTSDPLPGQRIEQVWFAGVHADCGGGYLEKGLSDVALTWMLRRAEECGLQFDRQYERDEIRPDPRQALHQARTGIHRILPTYERPILETNVRTERVHWSAAARFDDRGAGYKPDNLSRALERHGRGIVTDPSEDAAD